MLRRENDQLRTALATRTVIERAKVILAERFNMHVDEASNACAAQGRNRRIKLRALAIALIAREAWIEDIFGAGELRNSASRSRPRQTLGPVTP